MKKTSKIVAVVLAALLVVAAVVVLGACAKEQTAVAYGLVHKKGYVGKATATVKGETLTAADLNEACLPTQVKATAADGEFAVDVEGTDKEGNPTHTYYWKTVKWANVTATYDVTDGYKVGEQTLVEFFLLEANCEVYFEAVAANNVTVVTASGDKKDIMNASTLLKTENGYWGTPADTALGWKANVDATINYVLENGFDGASKKSDFTAKDNSATDKRLENEWVDKNGKNTGATWTDMWDYFNLLKIANDRAIAAVDGEVVTGEYTYVSWGNQYGAKVDVVVKDGKIVSVKLYTDDETGWVRTSPDWKENQHEGDLGFTKTEAAYEQWINDTFVGKTVDDVKAYKTDTTISNWTISDGAKLAGATQSAVRIVLAVQNALGKLAK